MSRNRLCIVDVFASAGGLSTGLAWASFDIALGVERDHDACESFAKAHPAATVLEADVASVVWGLWRHEDYVLVGGPPCQPWSNGGKRLGAEDERDGWPAFLQALRGVRPRAFLAETWEWHSEAPMSSPKLTFD